MARRRTARKNKSYKGKPRRYRRRAPGPRAKLVGQIPDKMLVTLKYNDRFTLSGTTGTPAIQRISCNSLHDPDLTGAGHQPLYYDQLVNTLQGNGLYHKYLVHSMSYNIKAVNTDTSVEQTIVVLPTTHGNTVTTGDNIDALCEAPYAKRRIMSTAGGGQNQATFKGTINIRKLEGVKQLDRSGYQATYGAAPSYQPVLNIVSMPMNESSSHNTLLDVTVYYKCEIYDRIYRGAVN